MTRLLLGAALASLLAPSARAHDRWRPIQIGPDRIQCYALQSRLREADPGEEVRLYRLSRFLDTPDESTLMAVPRGAEGWFATPCGYSLRAAPRGTEPPFTVVSAADPAETGIVYRRRGRSLPDARGVQMITQIVDGTSVATPSAAPEGEPIPVLLSAAERALLPEGAPRSSYEAAVRDILGQEADAAQASHVEAADGSTRERLAAALGVARQSIAGALPPDARPRYLALPGAEQAALDFAGFTNCRAALEGVQASGIDLEAAREAEEMGRQALASVAVAGDCSDSLPAPLRTPAPAPLPVAAGGSVAAGSNVGAGGADVPAPDHGDGGHAADGEGSLWDAVVRTVTAPFRFVGRLLGMD